MCPLYKHATTKITLIVEMHAEWEFLPLNEIVCIVGNSVIVYYFEDK